ncbi:MAG: hypothetical protein EOO46_11105 [Flavobacterium sp.]|nr:MAG: hypothetical protein EOO46_11105 [Flavobacterium sp.]
MSTSTKQEQLAELKEMLKHSRKLSQSTEKTYLSLLYNFQREHRDEERGTLREFFFEFFDRSPSEILAILEDSGNPNQSKRSILSAIRVLTNDEAYIDFIRVMNERVAQRSTEDQKTKKNKLSWEDVEAIVARYKRMVKQDDSYDVNDYHYCNWILVLLTSSTMIPCRRCMDWFHFKIRNVDKTKDNYLQGNKMIFNSYKTVSTNKEARVVRVPDELYFILRRWINHSKNDYLIFQENGRSFTSSTFTKRIQRLYGKGVSVSQLRSIYTSSVLRDDIREVEKLNETLTEKANEMGTSLNMLKTVYLKNKG